MTLVKLVLLAVLVLVNVMLLEAEEVLPATGGGGSRCYEGCRVLVVAALVSRFWPWWGVDCRSGNVLTMASMMAVARLVVVLACWWWRW